MDAVIAPMSGALYGELKRQDGETKVSTAARMSEGGPIAEGLRRSTLFRIARANVERGVPEPLVRELMLAINERQCVPPRRARARAGCRRGQVEAEA